jgi:hypothetical protein
MTDFKKHQFDASFFCIIVPFTTKIREPLLPSHTLTAAGSSSLRHNSVALCEQIRAIDKQRIVTVLGHLDQSRKALSTRGFEAEEIGLRGHQIRSTTFDESINPILSQHLPPGTLQAHLGDFLDFFASNPLQQRNLFNQARQPIICL